VNPPRNPTAAARVRAVLGLVLVVADLRVFGGPVPTPAAEEHAAQGRQLLERGDLSGAERELRKAVELSPEDPEVLGLLGVALGMQQKLQEADLYLEKALHLDPTDSATRRNLAWNQFELGQLAQAKANLARVLKEKPNDSTAILVMGMVEEELQHYPAALKLLASVPEQVRERPESLAALARAYYYTGQERKSHEILKELPVHPAGPESAFTAAMVAAELHDFAIAETLLQSVWTVYPDPGKLGYALARVEYRAGKLSESVATLRRTIETGHESSEIYNLLGWCLYKKDDAKGAVAALDRAIALDPADESNYLDVGIMLLKNHRLDGSLAAAEKAIEVAPGSSGGRRLKAQIEFQLRHVNDAEALYARAVELNPSDADAIAGLATAQLDMGKVAEAEETLKNAMQRLPRAAVVYQAYGTLLLWGEGRENTEIEGRAFQLLRQAETLDPSLSEPHYQLGKLALREGNLRDASRELELAVKLDPNGSKNHYGLAQVYRKLGRMADAEHEVRIFQALKEKETPSPADASGGTPVPAPHSSK
jgi:tetratricopeptide (TPR) repeat protein